MKKVISSILIALILFAPLTAIPVQADSCIPVTDGNFNSCCVDNTATTAAEQTACQNYYGTSGSTSTSTSTGSTASSSGNSAQTNAANAAATKATLSQYNPNVNLGSGNTYGGSSGSISISGVGGAIASCANVGGFLVNAASSLLSQTAIGSKITSLFGHSGNSSAVSTSDSKAQAAINTTNRISQCLNGVAYAVAKNTLAQITNKTLNWVNTGFNGNPLYVQNSGSYLNSIANQQITAFLPAVKNSDPIFGNALQAAITSQVTGKSAALAQLNTPLNTPQSTAYNSFMGDFTNGGWNSLLNPAYNPIGSLFNATDTLVNNVTSQQQQSQNEIQRNNGFLDMKRCVQYANNGQVSSSSEAQCSTINSDASYEACCTGQSADDSSSCNQYALTDDGGNPQCANITSDAIEQQCCGDGTGDSAVCIAYNTSSSSDAASTPALATTNGAALSATPVCTQYSTVTPGSVIANQVSTITTTPTRQLEYANQINEVLGSFFDSLVNNLLSKGLRGSSSSTSTPIDGLSSQGDNTVTDSDGNTLESDPSALGYQVASSGSAVDSDFDISRPQQLYAILQTQYDFLNRTKDSQIALERVIPTIGALDYCIPGPNPDWQTGLDSNWQSFLGSIQQADPKDTTTVEKIIGALPGVGGIASTLISLFTGSGSLPTLWTSDATLADKVTGQSIEINRTFYTPHGEGDDLNTSDLESGLGLAYGALTNTTSTGFLDYYDTATNTYGDASTDEAGTTSQVGLAFEAAAQTHSADLVENDDQDALYGFLTDSYTNTDSVVGYNQAATTIDQAYQQNISDTENDIEQLEVIRQQVDTIVATAKARDIADNPGVNVECLNEAYQIDTDPIVGVARLEPDTSDLHQEEDVMVQHADTSADYFYNNQIQ
jgi:hypothetical protein